MFAALYTLHAPIFLLNSERFKIFVENDARNEVFTYPFTEEDGANATEPIGERLVKALIICLLRNPSERLKVQMSRIPKAVAADVPQTPLKLSQSTKSSRKRSLKAIPDSIDKVKPTKRTRRNNQEDDLDVFNSECSEDEHEDFQIAELITPRFKCGEADDGTFLYQEVRVQELAEFIEPATGSDEQENNSCNDSDDDFPAGIAADALSREESAHDHFQTHYLLSSDFESC
ncbi:hypothetical protein MIR68_003010 [Amoeboaphelidium protococcarum]|nr:hypothetical protein MIR68_003010 [Amoeboaphelidium protococcarum]